MKYYLSAFRQRQWTKNLIVFSEPFFNFEFRSEIWFSACYAFVIFCMISSSVYLINDSIDIEVDKKHLYSAFFKRLNPHINDIRTGTQAEINGAIVPLTPKELNTKEKI